ncbi:MAG: ATP synthase F1 subunit gamma [bacterium]
MPNLKDIKRRIKSVKNTQKITQAMRMVAVAKVKKAENKVKASRPFSNELLKAFQRLLAAKPEINNINIQTGKAIDNYPALLKYREPKTVGLLVITSDRGLAGAYNANLVKKTLSRMHELEKDGISAKVFVVGLKGLNALKRAKIDIAETYIRMPVVPTSGQANVIVEDIAEYFVREEIDKIEIITTRFNSMVSFEAQLWQVLPVKSLSEEKKKEKNQPSAEMIFEPRPEVILQKIVSLYLSNRVYQALIEASASELAARSASMAAATKNAGDMIQHLTLVYNKARQASITQEILEIVGGANALKNA